VWITAFVLSLISMLFQATPARELSQGQEGDRLVHMDSVEIEKPFLATVWYTTDAEREDARIVIETDWEALGPEPAVALLNQTTDLASPRTMTPSGRKLTLWLDDAFPGGDDLADVNLMSVEIVTAKGQIGRSPRFEMAVR